MLLLLLLLIVVPITVWYWATRHKPRLRWLVTGAAFGVVASPWSLGLYATYFVPYVGLPSGMVGLFLVLVHGIPGFELAKHFGLIAPTSVVEGAGHFYVEALNALVWGPLYGAIGWILDRVHKAQPSECLNSS